MNIIQIQIIYKRHGHDDIVKESEDVSGSKNEEGSEMRVKGQYMGKEEEMRLQVVDKEENRRLVTRQTRRSI